MNNTKTLEIEELYDGVLDEESLLSTEELELDFQELEQWLET